MKKILSVLLAAIMSIGLFAACGTPSDSDDPSSKGGSEEKIKLRFMYWNKEDSLAELLKLIETELPHIDLEFQFVSTDSFQTVFKTQMNAGEGPDILSMEDVKSEVKAGYALDLTGQPFLEKYQDSVRNELAVDDKEYCIPGVSWFGGYFYNKTLFEENGWEIPATYDEWLDLCDKISDSGVKAVANPIKNPNYLMHYAMGYVNSEFLRQPEGMNWDKDFAEGKVTMSESWGPYLEAWAEVVERDHIKAEELGMDFEQALDEFVTGKAAMIDSGPWDVESIYSKNPDMKIDMMPFVGNKGDTGWLFGGPGIRFGLNSKLGEKGNEDKLQAALDIFELISTEEGQKAYWENNQGGSSYLKGVTFDMPEEYDGCKKVFEEGHVYAPWMQWNAGVFEEFGQQLQAYIAGDATLEEVMKNTDEKNKEIIVKMES